MPKKLIIDTNILFSSLLKKENIIKRIIFSGKVELFAPYSIFIEIFNHKEKIIKYSQLTETELTELLYIHLTKISLVNEKMIPLSILETAQNIVKEIDEVMHLLLALSIYLNIPIWSGDKKLINFLRSTKAIEIVTITELLSLLKI